MSAQEGGRDNACIINTAVQVANNPTRISIAAIKGNLTHDMILATGKCNLSPLSQDAPFSLFQHFGMQSGRKVDKFADFDHVQRAANGLLFLDKYANAYISCKVVNQLDLQTHVMFICDVVQCMNLSKAETMSYNYYLNNVKPKPDTDKKGYACKICGWVYEGQELP